MAIKTAVSTTKAPKLDTSIINQAIVANGMVFVSGSVPIDPETDKLVEGDIEAHTHQCIKNISAILEGAGSDITKVVKVNIFLLNIKDAVNMNKVYSQHWGDIKPCRACVAVKELPLGTDIEMECIAIL